DQLNLLFGKGADFLPVDGKDTDQLIFLEHWNIEDCSEASKIDGSHEDRFALDVSWLLRDIGNMNRLPRLDDAAEGSSRTGSLWSSFPELGKCWRYSEHCCRTRRATLETKQNSKIGLADTSCVLQHGVEHLLQLARRAGDNLQHLRGCRLLLPCLGKVSPRLVEFALACFELPFQIGARLGHLTNAPRRLRSGRTNFATVGSAFRAFARRGHLKLPPAEVR